MPIQRLQDNRTLRVNFMLDEITRDTFKTSIMKNHIDLNIKQQELLLYQLIRNFGIDLFNEFVQIFSKIQKYVQILFMLIIIKARYTTYYLLI